MDFTKLRNDCFIDKTKKVIPYVPELDVKLVKYEKKIWIKKFPQPHNNLEALQLTNIGVYSIATPTISKKMCEFVDELCKRYSIQNPIITETNGGLGGFTIQLAKKYNTLNIVEINPVHANIIKNNLDVYQLDTADKKINIIIADYLNIMDDLKSDVIICDPPWGGYDYSKQKSMRLGMNNINITCIINYLISRKLFKIFILMAPQNIDIRDIITNVNSSYTLIHNLGKHYLIAILNF
jgi:hypothetical protein